MGEKIKQWVANSAASMPRFQYVILVTICLGLVYFGLFGTLSSARHSASESLSCWLESTSMNGLVIAILFQYTDFLNVSSKKE